jgi:hypothetical protein
MYFHVDSSQQAFVTIIKLVNRRAFQPKHVYSRRKIPTRSKRLMIICPRIYTSVQLGLVSFWPRENNSRSVLKDRNSCTQTTAQISHRARPKTMNSIANSIRHKSWHPLRSIWIAGLKAYFKTFAPN